VGLPGAQSRLAREEHFIMTVCIFCVLIFVFLVLVQKKVC
jgi:hypothetical protein